MNSIKINTAELQDQLLKYAEKFVVIEQMTNEITNDFREIPTTGTLGNYFQKFFGIALTSVSEIIEFSLDNINDVLNCLANKPDQLNEYLFGAVCKTDIREIRDSTTIQTEFEIDLTALQQSIDNINRKYQQFIADKPAGTFYQFFTKQHLDFIFLILCNAISQSYLKTTTILDEIDND